MNLRILYTKELLLKRLGGTSHEISEIGENVMNLNLLYYPDQAISRFLCMFKDRIIPFFMASSLP